ncbi:glycosyltransferase family 76 protein [Ramaria rubella]|nr:glycosyltransferase family 76 protein [Ramaria rubella]
MVDNPPVPQQHIRHLLLLNILIRILVSFLALLASYLPTFDSSANILLADATSTSLVKRLSSTSLRWDAFHYLHISQRSYQFEYEWAFFPGVPMVLSAIERIVVLLTGKEGGLLIYDVLLGHFLLSTFVTCEAIRTLYLLTMQHTQSPTLSLLSGYLSLLSSSPATLYLAAIPEPWFTLFSYKGMLYCARKQWFFAGIFFTLASVFRANGFLLGGFIIWGLIMEPLINRQEVRIYAVMKCTLLAALPCLPFLLHQVFGYIAICSHSTPASPSWCTRRLPLIYTHVQSHYWNVGFLRYWTMQQLPNFLISVPVLLLLLVSPITYILHVLPTIIDLKPKPPRGHPLLNPSLLPHAIHAFILTCILLFASHTQIILRVAASMPFTYWSAARLFFEHPKWAKAWVAWSILWGTTSVVLWTTFLPPA